MYITKQVSDPYFLHLPAVMRFLLLDVAMSDLNFWTAPFLSCSILHLLFHLEIVCILGSINTALVEKDSKYYFHILLLQSATVGQLLLFFYYINCIIYKSAKSNHRKKDGFGFWAFLKEVMMSSISQN